MERDAGKGHVWLILFDGMPLVASALVRAMLDAGAGPDAGLLRLSSMTGGPVTTACGTQIAPDAAGWPSPGAADMVMLIAGATPDPAGYLPMGLRATLAAAQGASAPILALEGAGRVVAALGLSGRANVTTAQGIGAAGPVARWIAARHGTAAADRAMARIGLGGADRNVTRTGDKAQAAPAGCADPVLARMQAIMQDTLADPLPLATIAAQLGISAKALRTRSQRLLGAPPARIYLRARLDHAKGLITQTALPVGDVARAAGFASASAFTRAFRAEHGACPRSFRSGPTRAAHPERQA